MKGATLAGRRLLSALRLPTPTNPRLPTVSAARLRASSGETPEPRGGGTATPTPPVAPPSRAGRAPAPRKLRERLLGPEAQRSRRAPLAFALGNPQRLRRLRAARPLPMPG